MTCLKHLADAKKRVNADKDAMAIMDECDAFGEWAGAEPDPNRMCVELSQAHAADEALKDKFCAGCADLGVDMPSCSNTTTTTTSTTEAGDDPRWSGKVGPAW